jgi:hypothetical protein
MILRLAEVTTPTWNSAGPSSWYRKFRRLPGELAYRTLADDARLGPPRWRVLSTASVLQAPCFHSVPPGSA